MYFITVSFRAPEASSIRKITILLCSVVQLVIASGVGFGLSVLYPELINVFQSTRSNASLVQGLYMGISTGSGKCISVLIRKYRCFVSGCILNCVIFKTY